MLLSLCQTSVFADDWDFLSVNGYGTIGGAYQDNDKVMYRDSRYADQGSQGDFSFANYSVLGLQLDAKVTDALSFTLQGVVGPNNANGKLIDIEWANAKYQLSDSFDVRAGLMRLPIFMFSDILHVAYSYDTISLANMYSLVTINSYEGVELSHRFDMDEGSLFSTLLYGNTKSSVNSFDNNGDFLETDVTADEIYGVALKYFHNDLTLRASYIKTKVTLDHEDIDGAISQFDALGIPAISEAIQQYSMKNSPMTYFNLGARYDFENSYILGEYMGVESNSFLPDIAAYNLTAGYNFERWTPFVAYSKVSSNSNYQAISAEGMPIQSTGAIMAANQTYTQIAEGLSDLEVERASVGFRYDLYENTALKFQYDEQKSNEKLHIFSTAINFVF